MTDQPTPPEPDHPQQPSRPEPPRKRLVRSRSDRMIAGVCGGLAEYLGIDATLVRILVVVGTVLGFGSLVLAYLVGWVVIPEAD
jgi:phage shock protein C